MEAERDEALARIDDAEARVWKPKLATPRSRTSLVASMSNLVLRESLQAMRERLIKLEAGPLPTDMAADLAQLAASFSDLLTFEKESGTVRFNSDFTFSSGSDVLKGGTTEAISALADIMNAASASGFECEVIGHTDNVKVSNPATRAKHKNNTYLAVHRAISVRTALVGAGVTPARIKVAGYGGTDPWSPTPARCGSKPSGGNCVHQQHDAGRTPSCHRRFGTGHRDHDPNRRRRIRSPK